MSHRSHLAARRSELNAAPVPLAFGNKQGRPGAPQQVSFDQIVPLLLSAGAQRVYSLEWSTDPAQAFVRLTAKCGPVWIPLDFTAVECRAIAGRLNDAADVVDPPASLEGGSVEGVIEDFRCSPDAEALLAEFIAAAESDPIASSRAGPSAVVCADAGSGAA